MLRALFFILFFFLFGALSYAQIVKKPTLSSSGDIRNGRQVNDTILGNKFNKETKIELDAKTHYTDYKIITHYNDTIIIDTTLSFKKERLFNHFRTNQFENMSQHNLGATYSNLGYEFSEVSLAPEMGIRAKHQDFLEVDEVNYFHVPTPTSELFYKTGIQQGQVLNSLLTTNITPQLNASIGYKGLRSLGDYRNALVSHQNVRATTSFETKNKRYDARAHYVANNLLNQENGGLTDSSLLLFSSNNSEYTDRERLETNYTDAESLLKSNRFYLKQGFKLWQKTDTTSKKVSYLQLGHEFIYSNKHYNFNQDASTIFIGEAYQSTIADSTYNKNTQNTVFANLKSPIVLGKIGVKASLLQHNYGYNSVLYLDDVTIPSQIKGNSISAEANWQAKFRTFSLDANAGTILSGDINGNYLTGTASYKQDSLFTAKATLSIQSKTPNFNFLLYQSDYMDYNWYNDFKNENTRYLGFSVESEKLLDVDASITQKDSYTYFNANSKPQQYDEILSYVKVKAHKAVSYRKFTLDNTLLYQKVMTGSDVFRVPEIITENSLYFSDYIFKGDPMYLQTGITLKYFTNYKADEFNPLLNEFRLQNTTEIGNFPMLDVFVNAQIRRTRIFLKAENVSSFWTGRTYFSTPNQPYRDFTIRFGLVWNFFI